MFKCSASYATAAPAPKSIADLYKVSQMQKIKGSLVLEFCAIVCVKVICGKQTVQDQNKFLCCPSPRALCPPWSTLAGSAPLLVIYGYRESERLQQPFSPRSHRIREYPSRVSLQQFSCNSRGRRSSTSRMALDNMPGLDTDTPAFLTGTK
jgi:hypothetical protein